VAAVAEISYRAYFNRGVPVVVAPHEIDIRNAHLLRGALLRLAASGHATFVVDLSATQLCDTTALTVLVRAHKEALAEGGELRLVMPAPSLAVFALTGLDHYIPCFASVAEAVARPPAMRIVPARRSRAVAQGGVLIPG
jgi:anti-sigma B factor antagonist